LRAAVLAIGDELTCGYRLDTNSQVISRRLASVPIEVVVHLTVIDDRKAIQWGLRAVLEAAEVVVVTGGLGPTEDDMTRQAIAAYFGLELVEDTDALTSIQARFARRGRTMPESNRVQAQIPAGSCIIYNHRGTASGFYLSTEGAHIFATPGIPYEMEGMLEGFILPQLQKLVGTGYHTQRAALKVYGIAESEVNERIRPMLARDRNPLLGLLPSRGTITIELVSAASAPEKAQALVEADLLALQAEFGRYIISQDERDLPQVVAELLVQRGLTVATAELGTGGLVAARFTEPDGSERWFRRSMTFGSKWEASGTGKDSLLSAQDDALAMARAIRQAAGADVGVGVGAITIPEDSRPDRPGGVLYVAVSVEGGETCRRLGFNGGRARVREWAADAALALVRLQLLEQETEGEVGDQTCGVAGNTAVGR
jgi:nicotinamide-nucleotide amidase